MTDRLQGARFRRSPAGAAALTLVGLGLGAWGVVNSPIFGVDRIRVEGVRQLAADDVRGLTGIEPGENLLRLSLDRIRAAVERSPWVAAAYPSRSLPTTLVIRILERRAAGWLEDPSGPAVVAVDGTVVDRAKAPPRHLPSLGSISLPLEPGERLPEPPITLRVASSLGDELLESVASVAVMDGEVLLELRAGGEVRYGEPVLLEDKNRALAEMLAWAQRHGVGVDYVDVRIPGAPALHPSRPLA